MPWIPNGPAIRARRDALGLSRAELADRTKLSVRTIARLERGEVAARTPTFHTVSVCLAMKKEAAGTWVEDKRSHGYGKLARGMPRDVLAAHARANREQAAKQAAAEARATRDLRRIRDLTPQAAEAMDTVYLPHRGRRFRIRGRVTEQLAVTNVERIALGAEIGVGARFLVMCEAPDGGEFPITVYGETARRTRRLQDAIGAAKPLVAVIRVVVVETSADFATQYGGPPPPPLYFAKNWRGFSRFGDERLWMWAFVVGADGREGPKPMFGHRQRTAPLVTPPTSKR